MRLFIQGILISSLVLSCTGCGMLWPYTHNRGPRQMEEKVTLIVKGTTTKKDVLRILGKPLSVSHKEDGSQVLFYEHVHMSSTWSSTKNDIIRVSVYFDPQEIVTNYTLDEAMVEGPYYQTAAEAQAGAAAQQHQAAMAAHQAAVNSSMRH